ncbi:hypothetical protein HOU00_gp126 [Caulobacter phage CcrPW]|uniref:Uncharacterized protein n=1 Tax=Caulobacter phage CcrPW TaxID=2283271 RepID=A0A385ECW8_9CAUD|nr:hypothetical protein HOU00_gp010 [Caulobacter phage CcrPW]YP_009809629.1 hypothetical protein HOU00_gp126 [Caulobacter phage CcrPW]AXQ68549.1 hypothetical protein CcrPW_gp010 [Caulobacter phage CcrPW]AXQ68999.1 hypothetical protein CcrPW_gp460 [Caulobacter phage CcrPW]
MFLWIWTVATDELTPAYKNPPAVAPEGCLFLMAANQRQAERARDLAKAAG